MPVRARSKRSAKQQPLLPPEWPEAETYATSRERESPEELFGRQLRARRINAVPQLQFARSLGRGWRFDWAIPSAMLAIEIEGLVMRKLAGQLVVMGRHASPAGIKEDMVKYNSAVLLGWHVLRFEQHDIKPRRAIDMTLRVLAAYGFQFGDGADAF
jgi:hypothetical protein